MKQNKKEDMANFFSKIKDIFDSIFDISNDPEAVKRRQLRVIARNFESSRYRKFLNLRKKNLTPDFAYFINNFYETNASIAASLNSASSVILLQQLKMATNLILLPKKLQDVYYSFDDNLIAEKVKEIGLQETIEFLKQQFLDLKNFYNKDFILKVNLTYKNVIATVNFFRYDYYHLLKKFDKMLPEKDFTYKPKFIPIYDIKAAEDLKDFHQILLDIDFTFYILEDVITIINLARNTNHMTRTFEKSFKNLKDFSEMNIIQDMVALVDENPKYNLKPKPISENIAQFFVEKVGRDIQKNIFILREKMRNMVAVSAATNIFSQIPKQKLTNYSDKINNLIMENHDKSFQYTQILNLLKAFIDEIYDKFIKDIIDHYILKTKWKSQSVEKSLSEYFHEVKNINKTIVEFDDSLSDSKKLGASIRNYARNADNTSVLMLSRLIKQIDQDALGILNNTLHNFLKMAKALKYIIDDRVPKNTKIVSNWVELDKTYKNDNFFGETKEAYEKIENFIKLVQKYFK